MKARKNKKSTVVVFNFKGRRIMCNYDAFKKCKIPWRQHANNSKTLSQRLRPYAQHLL